MATANVVFSIHSFVVPREEGLYHKALGVKEEMAGQKEMVVNLILVLFTSCS